MKKRFISIAIAALGIAGAAHAESSVKVYGVLDTGLEHLSSSDGTSLTLMMKTAHVPSRIGFSGSEYLDNGIKAGFVLEAPIFVDSGSLPPDGRLFGRQAFVSIGSTGYGDLRAGRQYSFMQTALAVCDPDHFSPYSPALAMQLANIDQTSLDNAITYWSPEKAGFSLALGATLGDGASVAPNLNNPQIVGIGKTRNGSSAMLQYRHGGLSTSLAYQGGGQDLTAGGSATQKMFSAGINYRLDALEVGSVLWTHRNKLPNDATPAVTVLAVGGAWRVIPAVRLNIELGRAEDNGVAYTTGVRKSRGINNYYNLGANYNFSERTVAYVRAGRVTDKNSGFNGRPAAVSPSAREGVAVPVNGSVKGIMAGMRYAF